MRTWLRSLGIAVAAAMFVSLFVSMMAAQEAPPQNSPTQNIVTATPSVEVLTPVSKPPDSQDTDAAVIDPASLLPDLPPVPSAKASLIGGTIGKLDRVRDHITVQVFGGGKMTIAFDTRTRIYNDGKEGTTSDLRQGDRIYIESILDGSTVFARSIHVKGSRAAGESQGVVTGYRADKGEMQMRDALSPQPIKIRVNSQTKIVDSQGSASTSARLEPGTLVAVKFGARQDGGEVAREISILAVPGASFTFAGRVIAIDLRLGLLVLASSSDRKTYEISVDPSVLSLDENLRPSADVTVLTRFEGNKYVARSVTVNSPGKQ